MNSRARLMLMMTMAAGLWVAREQWVGDELVAPPRTAGQRAPAPRTPTAPPSCSSAIRWGHVSPAGWAARSWPTTCACRRSPR